MLVLLYIYILSIVFIWWLLLTTVLPKDWILLCCVIRLSVYNYFLFSCKVIYTHEVQD